ncbi:MAG TPA: sigma-70 family RNA polymerase sigma factor [Rhodocyclaceae bacterium]|nr:sigma-70 family RNA polymerase sigma factor [Rhodocyclaceae bacterium]
MIAKRLRMTDSPKCLTRETRRTTPESAPSGADSPGGVTGGGQAIALQLAGNEPGRSFDVRAEMSGHHRFLHNLAALQLNSRQDADDVVQETFLAALNGIAGFSGQVPFKAWLVGILRNKIVDAIRRRTRFVSVDSVADSLEMDAGFDALFTGGGDWRPEAVAHGQCPESLAERNQLLDLVELCMARLPANTCRVFLMREYLGFEFAEIAGELKLSEGNLRVLLYRARMSLRDCVSRGWGEWA